MVNLVNMPVSRQKMEQYENRHVKQIEHAHKQWEARDNKIENMAKRREWMQRQNNANYRNEYDRLRSELSRGRIPHGSLTKLRNRLAELEKLFSSSSI